MVRRLSREGLRRLVVNEARRAMRLSEARHMSGITSEIEQKIEELIDMCIEQMIDDDAISPMDGEIIARKANPVIVRAVTEIMQMQPEPEDME